MPVPLSADDDAEDADDLGSLRAALGHALRDQRDATAIQAASCRVLGAQLDVDRVFYAEVSPDEQALVSADFHTQGLSSIAGRHRLDSFGRQVAAQLRAGHTVVQHDVDVGSAASDASEAARAPLQARARIEVPLVKGRRLAAFLAVHQARPRVWTKAEQLLLDDAAQWIWAAIDRVDAERGVRRREARLSALFTRSTAGMSELALDGRVVRVNDELCKLLGRSREELLAARVGDVIHPDDLASFSAAVQRLIETGEPASVDARYVRPDGAVVVANSSLTRLDDLDGRPQSVLAITVDMTERTRAAEGLQAAHAELERRIADRTAELAATNARLRQEMAARDRLRRQMATVQEDERRRISRDLHDQTGQLLAALSLAVRSAVDGGELPPRAAEQLQGAQDIIAELSRQVHGLAVRLRPTVLDDLGLDAALAQLASDWTTHTGIGVDVQADAGRGARLPAEIETTMYRVVQEALTNVARHARAKTVSVVASCSSGVVSAIIEDDGVGFVPELVQPERLGLRGMSERLALLGGTLAIESRPGAGTTVVARVRLRLPERRLP